MAYPALLGDGTVPSRNPANAMTRYTRRSFIVLSALVLSIGLGVLAGCGREPVGAPEPNLRSEAPASGAAAPTARAGASAASPTPAYDPMPAGIAPHFGWHVRNDRIYLDGKERYRRRVTFEYLSGSAEDVFRDLDGALVAAGFQAKGEKRVDSRVQAGYTRRGTGALLLAINPKQMPNPAHPRARGIFTLDYPYPRAGEAGGDDAPE